MIADYGMYSGYLDRTQQDRTFAEIASLMSGGIFEASFLSGLDDFMRIVQSFNGDGDALNYELAAALRTGLQHRRRLAACWVLLIA